MMNRTLFILTALFFGGSLQAQVKCNVSQPFVLIHKQTPGNIPVIEQVVVQKPVATYVMQLFFNSTCNSLPVIKKLRINNKIIAATVEVNDVTQPIGVNDDGTSIWLQKKEGRYYFKITLLLDETLYKKYKIPSLHLLLQQHNKLFTRVSKNWKIIASPAAY
ncbi:hypothetical protein ACFOWM_09605 [Ferruginibacter yonginensis]|uniref:Uncharacterized protein n=1 Tax=Ferruginibacter yonginensis TaxID=1310416 RepID=A0ABV8QVS6_9BACT